MARRHERILLTLGVPGLAILPLAAVALSACGSSDSNATCVDAAVPLDAVAETGLGTGELFNCGRVTSIFDNIGETMVGLSISVQGTSAGPSQHDLAFAWSSSPPNAGTFSPRTGLGGAPSASFTCGMPGAVTITLTASDGTVPDGAPGCHDVDHMSIVVVCDPLPEAGAGG